MNNNVLNFVVIIYHSVPSADFLNTNAFIANYEDGNLVSQTSR